MYSYANLMNSVLNSLDQILVTVLFRIIFKILKTSLFTFRIILLLVTQVRDLRINHKDCLLKMIHSEESEAQKAAKYWWVTQLKIVLILKENQRLKGWGDKWDIHYQPLFFIATQEVFDTVSRVSFK